MNPSLPYRPPAGRVTARGFAAGGLVAAIAAVTLTACGPRDDAPLARGSAAVASPTTAAEATGPAEGMTAPVEPGRVANPVPTAPTATAALAPAPADAPLPPVTIAAAPADPMQAPNGYVPAPQYAPVVPAAPTGSYQDGPPPGRPVPAAQPGPPPVQPAVAPRDRAGSITAIEPVRQRPQGSGTGAVIGGVLGGVLGNQFGHGLGRAAMTGVGAAGGAIAGNNVERNYKTAVVGYRVHVRLDNGSTRTFERKNIGNLHVGDRVRLDAKGLRGA